MNYRLLIIVLGLGLLAGLFFLLRPASLVQETGAPASKVERPVDVVTAPASSLPLAAKSTEKRFELVVRNRQLASGPTVLSVSEGDTVTIGITSDQAEELHLHGYNRKLELLPGAAGAMTLTADRSGRFEYELEHARIVLGVLEVQPR